MQFTKMQGCGNDYVYVDTQKEQIRNPSALAQKVSDRHFGIGADGLILIGPSEKADFSMKMYNADGSQGAMCGNGIRCVGKYVYDHGMTGKTQLTIETAAGIRVLLLQVENGRVNQVTVEMGAPEFRAERIPVVARGATVMEQKVTVMGKLYCMTCLSMGNPHAVVWVEDVEQCPVEQAGPAFEHLSCFPDRVNTEFVQILDEHTIRLRVWERGSGETLSCGTGACAAAVASVLAGRISDGEVTAELRGGRLLVRWDRMENQVFLTGPAVTVFEGTLAE